MKSLFGAAVSFFIFSTPAAFAADLVQQEVQLEAAAHAGALAGNTAQVDADLAATSGLFGSAASTVSLARRAAAVCGWLENDNRYDLAIALANRVLPQLTSAAEASTSDREERLYWQGWLQGKVIDNKAAAITTLKAAEQLSPQDERVVDLELEMVLAVQNFGH